MVADRHAHLPARAHVADRRGLTALGAAALAIGLGLLGGTIDVLTGEGLGPAFAACFVVGCALAAGTVHREDVRAAVVMPPLAYAALALGAAAVRRTDLAGPWVMQQALELAAALVVGAPVLLAATGAAVVVAVGRHLYDRRT